jgi:CelD/BcsL family acetyltransferase involved in cellulose biosynthesis
MLEPIAASAAPTFTSADSGLVLSIESFERLESDWSSLLARARTRNVFITWPFLATWWQQLGRDRQLRLFVVRDQDRVVAIVPLCITLQNRRFGHARVLTNVGYGDVVNPDFLDALIEPGYEPAVARLVWSSLSRDDSWDYAEFGDLDAEGSLIRIVRAWETIAGLEVRIEPKAVCPYIPLQHANYDAFLAKRNSHFRQQLRRYRRVIERELSVIWQQVGVDLPIDAGIAALTRLHQERMEATERGGNFKKADYLAFHRELAARTAKSGDLFFWVLFSGDEAIATHYGFLHAGVYYGYQMGFTHKYAKYSPGHYMTGVVIEKLLALGARELNLLRGTDAWKFRWTDATRMTATAFVVRPNWTSRWAHARMQLSQSPALVLRHLIGRENFDELRKSWSAWSHRESRTGGPQGE